MQSTCLYRTSHINILVLLALLSPRILPAGYLDTHFVILHFSMSPPFHDVFILECNDQLLICYCDYSDS